MSVTIAPKKNNTENDTKKSIDHRLAPKNKDIVIKRSKSTGIVLKQKKSHIGSIKHFHPRSVLSSTPKGNDAQKTSKKLVPKEAKDLKPRSKPLPIAKEDKLKSKKADPPKNVSNPAEKAKPTISPSNPDTVVPKVTELNKTNINKENANSQPKNLSKKSDTEQSLPKTAILASIEKESCDSGDTLTDKKVTGSENLNSDAKSSTVKASSSSGTNEKEFSIKNGLNTPPLSTLNTSTNSDVEMINDETNKPKEELTAGVQPKSKSPITHIPSKHIYKTENKNTENSTDSVANGKLISQESISNKAIKKQKSSSNTNMDSLSGIKSESVPMTPSYTKSIEEEKKNLVEQPQKTASFLKSPKEESLDGVKLSKKASQLKKKIVQRKSKNDVLKLELNQLIENLQHLKKQYDMISTTFNDDFDDTSLKKDIDPDSLINTAMEGINANFVKEHVAQSKADMIDIPGYYIKRSGDAIFGDIDEAGTYLSEPKKRKSGLPTFTETQSPAPNATKTVNDILSNNFVFNASLAQEKLSADISNVPLLTFDEILQPSEKKMMDFALDDNVGPGVDDKRAMSNGFDFLLDINDDLKLDDDINMDFFNF